MGEGKGLTMKILVAVDAGPLWSRPTRRIHPSCSSLPVALTLLPVHHQRNRVLCALYTAETLRNAFCRTSRHSSRHPPLTPHHTFAHIDVVAVEIVADVAVLAGPGLERLELRLRLRHIAVEVVEVAERLGAVAGVGVCGVETLVVLDVDEDTVLASGGEQRKVVLEQLGCWFGDQDVVAALDGVECDGVVGRVGREDRDCRVGR